MSFIPEKNNSEFSGVGFVGNPDTLRNCLSVGLYICLLAWLPVLGLPPLGPPRRQDSQTSTFPPLGAGHHRAYLARVLASRGIPWARWSTCLTPGGFRERGASLPTLAATSHPENSE